MATVVVVPQVISTIKTFQAVIVTISSPMVLVHTRVIYAKTRVTDTNIRLHSNKNVIVVISTVLLVTLICLRDDSLLPN